MTEEERLTELIQGATVTSVQPNHRDEGHFNLNLRTRTGKTLRVQIFGTDMGWWFEKKKR